MNEVESLLDIFQNWINNTFGADNETSATIITTFIIFFFGYLITGFVHVLANIYNRMTIRQITERALSSIPGTLRQISDMYYKQYNFLKNNDRDHY